MRCGPAGAAVSQTGASRVASHAGSDLRDTSPLHVLGAAGEALQPGMQRRTWKPKNTRGRAVRKDSDAFTARTSPRLYSGLRMISAERTTMTAVTEKRPPRHKELTAAGMELGWLVGWGWAWGWEGMRRRPWRSRQLAPESMQQQALPFRPPRWVLKLSGRMTAELMPTMTAGRLVHQTSPHASSSSGRKLSPRIIRYAMQLQPCGGVACGQLSVVRQSVRPGCVRAGAAGRACPPPRQPSPPAKAVGKDHRNHCQAPRAPQHLVHLQGTACRALLAGTAWRPLAVQQGGKQGGNALTRSCRWSGAVTLWHAAGRCIQSNPPPTA